MREKRITALEAAKDPRLLRSDRPWPVQELILEAADGPKRVLILRLGRRGGKGFVTAQLALHNLLLSPHLSQYVRKGEQRFAVIIARREDQAALVKDTALSIVQASPSLARMVVDTSDTTIVFSNGTTLLASPNSADSDRGKAISFLGLSEAGHWIGEGPDQEMAGERSAYAAYAGLAPAMAQFGRHGLIVIELTPSKRLGRAGFFYDSCCRAESGEWPEAIAFHYSSAEANPLLDPEFLAAEEARDPENYRVEYLADWPDGGASQFLDFERFAPY